MGLVSIFRKNKLEKAPGTKSSPFKLVAGDRNVYDPGARFSKVPIINEPVKLLLFYTQGRGFNSFASNVTKLSVNETE